ncbi:MAG: exosortase/archaeosortase family protein [Planctomycetota bacterium]
MAATISSIPTRPRATDAPTQPVARFSLAPGEGRVALYSLLGLVALALLSYWEILEETANVWSQPQYSHGWIIPLIGLFIMWSRRPKPLNLDAVDFGYVRPLGGLLIGLCVVGQLGLVDLPLPLAGLGLAGFCLLALYCSVVEQEYGAPTTESQDVDYSALWSITAVGALITVAGLADVVGLRLPGLSSGSYQALGLIMLILGGLSYATFAEVGAKAGVAETAYATTLTALSIAAWCYAVQVDMLPVSRVSFIATLVGAFGMVGGMRLLRWAGPPVAFCAFMFPLPTRIEGVALGFLQKVAVMGSEAIYVITGTPVTRVGSRIEVQGVPMEVAEACSGLSMSTILIAMAIAMVLLVKRPWWDKLIILISSIPIALLSNIFRIVVTGYAWVILSWFSVSEQTMTDWQKMSHDNIGILLMMPFALGLYWLELKVLSMLTIADEGLDTQGGPMLGRTSAPTLP